MRIASFTRRRLFVYRKEYMKYIFLTDEFYKTHPKELYPEMIRKNERPYVQILINVNNQLWAIPLRSHINHEYAFWSDRDKKCGIDFTKAVPISTKDIRLDKVPRLRQHEYIALKRQGNNVTSQFKNYIKQYIHAKENPHTARSKAILRFSTLQHFEE